MYSKMAKLFAPISLINSRGRTIAALANVGCAKRTLPPATVQQWEGCSISTSRSRECHATEGEVKHLMVNKLKLDHVKLNEAFCKFIAINNKFIQQTKHTNAYTHTNPAQELYGAKFWQGKILAKLTNVCSFAKIFLAAILWIWWKRTCVGE